MATQSRGNGDLRSGEICPVGGNPERGNLFSLFWETIHKPGKPRHQVDGYRPIALQAARGKLFARCLYNRMRQRIDAQLSEEQVGFRTYRRGTDHILTARNLQQAYHAKGATLAALFVDIRLVYRYRYTSVSPEEMATADPGKSVRWEGTQRGEIYLVSAETSRTPAKLKEGAQCGRRRPSGGRNTRGQDLRGARRNWDYLIPRRETEESGRWQRGESG